MPRGCHRRRAELGGGCFVGRGQQLVVWLLGLLGACSPGTMVGGGHECCGAGKWARGEPTTCLGLAVPSQRQLPLPSPHPAASRALPPKIPPTHPSVGIGGRQELWGLTLTCDQGGPEQGEHGHCGVLGDTKKLLASQDRGGLRVGWDGLMRSRPELSPSLSCPGCFPRLLRGKCLFFFSRL